MRFWSISRQRHRIGDEELNAYIDGELDAAARSRVEAHMESCAACRETVGELRTVSQALQALPGAQAPRSFALREADVKPMPAQRAGWLAGATPLLGGVATVAFLAFFVLVGVDVADRSADSDAGSAASRTLSDERLSSETAAEDTAFGAEIQEGPPDDGAPPLEDAPLAATGADIPDVESQNNGGVASDEDPADGTTRELLDPEPGDDDNSRLRIAEAATAAVALAAGGSLALVWWRRRA